MRQQLALTALVVHDYDAAIEFFVGTLGFELIEDTPLPEQNKRWVVVAPKGAKESRLLLAQADGEAQAGVVGRQAGGRVLLFLHTDDFWRDYRAYQERGVRFTEEPREEVYGTVAVFEDVAGNLWDLLEPR